MMVEKNQRNGLSFITIVGLMSINAARGCIVPAGQAIRAMARGLTRIKTVLTG
jgi:hypothetical protein